MIVRGFDEANIVKTKKPVLKKLTPWFFLLPHLIFFAVFVVFPFFYGIVLSFFKSDLMASPTFIGFQNYIDIFTTEPFRTDFIDGLKHTLLYTVIIIPLIILVPLGLAVWLYAIKNEKIRAVFQAILYSTAILSIATVVFVWQYMFDYESGFINKIFNLDINWKNEQPYNWIIIFSLTLWAGIGGNMIIFLSSISSIPKSQYEAANIDGISKWRQFYRLTLPSLKFPLVFSFITGTIGAFNVFGQPYLYGGPNRSTETIIIKIKDYAFGSYHMAGIASAMSVMLGLIIVVVSVVQFKITRAEEK